MLDMKYTAHRTQVNFDSDTYHYVVQNAAMLGISISEYLRRLVDGHKNKTTVSIHVRKGKKKYANPWMEIAGIGKSGPKDGSINHDKYLYDE